jgi:hypothetical protein
VLLDVIITGTKKWKQSRIAMHTSVAGTQCKCTYTLFYSLFRLCIFFCGCETWSVILREENRLRVFENRVLRTVYGPKSKEVEIGWRMLCNEELHNLYSSPNSIRVIKSRRI